MIDQATIDRIMDAAQIYDVVSEYVTLRKRGISYVGLCPFHDDKTPSFYVTPSKNICKCFACGKGGTAVHFIMEHEQLSYPDALRFLAKKYGIEIKEKELTNEQKMAQNERESLFIVNQYARDYFQDILRNHVDGRSIAQAYFRQRGIRDDIIEKFQLGYCTTSRDAFAETALKKGYKREYLVKTGLCYETDDKKLRDRFWGRVIFPWLNLSGKVVAFGGRVLDSRTKGVAQKYVNSPESEIYSKGRELYGIYQAKQAIVKKECVYMVEGYTDVIAMHQCGIENVVANSGTALSEAQIRMLHRFTDNITLLYDGDAAGIKASLRGIDMLLEEGMNVKVCLLPDGDDPDSFARKHNSEEFQTFIHDNENDFIIFKANLLLGEAGKDPVKRAELIGSLIQSISVIPEAITRDVYIKECAQLLHVEEKLLVNEVAKRRERQAEIRAEQAERERQRAQRIAQQPGVQPAQPASPTGEPAPAPMPGETDEPSQLPPLDSFNGADSTPSVSLPPQFGSPIAKEEDEFREYELQILQMLVRYGEREMCVDTNEAGEEVPLTVIEYIDKTLKEYELTFRHPLRKRILTEAIDHLHQEGFSAEHYFLTHPDSEISRLCSELITDRYTLSKYHTKGQTIVDDAERLHELVPTLMIEYKYVVVGKELKQLQKSLQDPAVINDADKCNEVMARYSELRALQSLMAKRLGDRVVLH